MSPLLLLAPRVTDDSVRVWRAAMDLGWEVKRLATWRMDATPEVEREVIVYAEPLFAEAVADQIGRVLLEPPPDWLPKVPEEFRLRQIGLCSLSEAREMEGPVFVKPAEGKVFEARVYSAGNELPGEELVDGSLTVIWSEPVNFTLEVRCFVLRGEVLSMSPYWRNGELAEAQDKSWPFFASEEQEARQFVGRYLREHTSDCPAACVVDVGIIDGRGWAIIEANPCWGAGLYGCSPNAALETGRAAFVHRAQMTDELWRWTSPRSRR